LREGLAVRIVALGLGREDGVYEVCGQWLSLSQVEERVALKHRPAATAATRYAALVDAATEAIVSADVTGTILTWNQAAATLYGYTEEEILGQPLSILVPPARAGGERRVWAAVARGATVKVDTQSLSKSGALVQVSLTLSRIMDAGALVGFCVVSHDISQRLRARDDLEAMVRERTDDLFRSRAETLHSLALAAEFRDNETAQHTRRVGGNSARLASRLGMRAGLVGVIREAAPLHDVGKIGIPDQILLKPGTLTSHERRTMQQHTVLGAQLLAGSESEILQMGEKIAIAHHERWDGAGYPDGLTEEEIPLPARIVSVVDTFDAITRPRPYSSARATEEAKRELVRCSGSQFDPQVVDAFLHLYDRSDAPPVTSTVV
jgi:PAS domain S-box-containing protein